MNKVAIFLGVGYEEIEVVGTVDVLRRGGVQVDMVSVSGNISVEGAHGMSIQCDRLFYEVDFTEYELLILPGGPGVANLKKHEGLMHLLPEFYQASKKVAAICAAPSILGMLNLLEGKEAICYPGFEEQLIGARISKEDVVTDGLITTAKGAGVTMAFGLELLKHFCNEKDIALLKERLIM